VKGIVISMSHSPPPVMDGSIFFSPLLRGCLVFLKSFQTPAVCSNILYFSLHKMASHSTLDDAQQCEQ